MLRRVGLRGVGFANLIHFLFKYAALVITAIFAWRHVKSPSGRLGEFAANPFFNVGRGHVPDRGMDHWKYRDGISTQYVIQTISSLKTPEEAKKASIFAALWLAPLGFIAAYIGLAARALFPTIKSVRALPEFLKYMNPWLAGIVATGILAVAFVTILACHLGATASGDERFLHAPIQAERKTSDSCREVLSAPFRTATGPICVVCAGHFSRRYSSQEHYAQALQSLSCLGSMLQNRDQNRRNHGPGVECAVYDDMVRA